MKWIFLLSVLAQPVLGQDCPAAPEHSAAMESLLAALQTAPGDADARILNDEIWKLWTDAPDEKAQALLDEGMARREGFDFLGARDVLDALVEYCPDYAEGYNQRAFANFLRQDYAAALHDLDRALELNPKHYAALSGRGLTLMGLGRLDEAQEALKAAAGLNPWLSERSLITEPTGTDI
jgi:tetratricopeptide (TPR) repeat protein